MKYLHAIRRILAVAGAIWALGAAAYFLLFAKISFESVTVSANQGEPPVTTNYSGQHAWLSEAEPYSVLAVLTFSLLLVACAVSAWRGALAAVVPLCLLALIASYITGFSIGGLYFPSAAILILCAAVLAIEELVKHANCPAA